MLYNDCEFLKSSFDKSQIYFSFITKSLDCLFTNQEFSKTLRFSYKTGSPTVQRLVILTYRIIGMNNKAITYCRQCYREHIYY